jgi:hypothetical protein
MKLRRAARADSRDRRISSREGRHELLMYAVWHERKCTERWGRTPLPSEMNYNTTVRKKALSLDQRKDSRCWERFCLYLIAECIWQKISDSKMLHRAASVV